MIAGLSSIAMAIAADITLSYPPELPVSARRDDLLRAIGEHQVVIVAGQTGSGKTTQLPKICLELGRTAIAHTQPRRIAARTVATRIAEELGVQLGSAVGYAVRFDDRSGSGTLVRLVTDGLLLAEIQRDRLLRRYDTIILDEAHERSLNIDFLLGYLKQLLPQRPDLKLVITSATIDTARFSEHFGGAPVVEVSGRTYPVEVRYRPVVEEDDPVEAIGDAVEELLHDAPGDVLVFLSGEREIRDTAEALAGRLPQGTGILPLYARLSPAEQQRVFSRHSERRVVLATNVAETSLTVPGIGAVVDPGTARISRYSARLKVQRLPIEPISQASANQRMGRCGRTSDGICIRLYSEQDFLDRPAFTDPEILRTSLAAVILQMEALALGEIEDFGFLDPPDRRQIRDGKALLHELGALDLDAKRPGRRLTALGRRLAQLPVDPRIGRMVLEADRAGCADEVVVIAAALSIQDPRIRPGEKRAEADERHARFKDERSDFLAYVNLWRHLRAQQQELSRSGFRKMCHADYLHYMRVREWQDLAGQLRQAARNVGVTINEQPAAPDDIHRALLAGLLSHVGLRDGGRREYDGARGARFTLSPGSALARKQPTWVMVAELVETNRLWGHTAAQIQPRWIEPLAGHLLKRTHAEPHWERKRASVVATERATLYGMPVVAARTVAYGVIDPVLSRELFIRHALLQGDWTSQPDFLQDNRDMLEEVQELEHRARRRDIVATEHELYDFYDARVPPQIVSGAHFDRWWKDERRGNPGLLNYTRDVLVGDAGIDEGALPDTWRQGPDVELALSYRFEPGAVDDGVTAHVPLSVLTTLRDTGFDWLVPGLREELVTALIRSLPKELRRPLVPIPETAAQVVAGLRARRGALVDAIARELERVRGLRVDPAQFDLGRLPAYLRMRFSVEDEGGTTIAAGEDLAALRDDARPRLRAQLAAAAARYERGGLLDWTIGELPRSIALPGTSDSIVAYPALVDEGASVAVRAFESPHAQGAAMLAGTRRLLALTVPSPLRAVQRGLGSRAALTLAGAPHGGASAVLDDVLVATIDALIATGGGPAWDAAGFAALRGHVMQGLTRTATAVVHDAVAVLDAAAELRTRLETISPEPALQPARLDVAAQLGGLVYAGFVASTGADRLPDVVRYLRAAVRRLDRLPDAVAADRDRMNAINELELEFRARGGRAAAPAIHWMLQELRVAQFAQGLGVQGTASAKQVRRALAAI
jgi:ATP-dependent helicase HrpA